MPKRPVNAKPPAPPIAPPTADEIRDISVAVYLERLGPDAQPMLDEVGEKGVRSRAGAYDTLSRVYIPAVRKKWPS